MLKVASTSKPQNVAASIAAAMRQEGNVSIQTVGAGALNQAIKALAIARGICAPGGMDLLCRPSFECIEMNGEEKTALKLTISTK